MFSYIIDLDLNCLVLNTVYHSSSTKLLPTNKLDLELDLELDSELESSSTNCR